AGGGAPLALPGSLQRRSCGEDVRPQDLPARAGHADRGRPDGAARGAAAHAAHHGGHRGHAGPDRGHPAEGAMSKFQRLAVLPVVWVAVFLALDALLYGSAAWPTFLRSEVEAAKALTLIGSWAAALAFEKGAY